jgi:hypothetical protein
VAKQYQMNMDGLKGMLLSTWAKSIMMDMPLILFVTEECSHKWQPRKPLPNFPLQIDL